MRNRPKRSTGFIQVVTVEGEDLVLSFHKKRKMGLGMGEAVRTTRWRGAAKFVHAVKKFTDKKTEIIVMAIPQKANIPSIPTNGGES